MKTREDYMDNKVSHREYYGQFVNDGTKNAVINAIGMDWLLASKDEHLNNIPLKLWDELSGFIFRGSELVSKPYTIAPIDINKLKEANEGVSPAVCVCIYKESARQIIEEVKK